MKKQTYIAPLLTVVSFKTEKGFAQSGGIPLIGFLQIFDREEEMKTQESWSEHSTWSSNGDGFF